MTIHELLAAAGLTANDEIPIWDAEATGEPTKKITAANLASAVVTLANLVSGVKGNAESDYRHGNVNLTPSNIGAVAKSGGDMTGGINFLNSDSKPVGGINYVHDSNGTDRTYLIARTLDSSSNIQLGVKRNGDNSLSYHFSNPAQFRQDAGITPANIGAAPEIQVATVTATTDSNGNISLSLSGNSYVVVSAKVTSRIVIPWVSGSDNNWHARITAINGNAVTDTSVTVAVYYQAV